MVDLDKGGNTNNHDTFIQEQYWDIPKSFTENLIDQLVDF
jgi:hypothetical protein